MVACLALVESSDMFCTGDYLALGESSDMFCTGGLSTDVLTVRGHSLKRDSSSRKCSFSGDILAGSITSQTSAESGD